jgi:hypothetical protein
VLDTPSSLADVFLWRVTCVSSIHVNEPILNREPISTLKNVHCRKYSFGKLTQFSQGCNVTDATPYNTHGFHSRDICCLQLS